MFAPISIDLTAPADHELHAQRTAAAQALIEQRKVELETAKDADRKVIEDAVEADPRLDWSMLDEGCYCHHPTTMAPCGYCESIGEEVFEAREALGYAQDALKAAERELTDAAKIIAPTLLAIKVVPEPELGCEDSNPEYAFTAFDVGVVTRKCTSRAVWRVKAAGGFRHVCDHCLTWNHSKWSKPETSPIYTSERDYRTGTMSCADRIRAQAHSLKLLAEGGGGRQVNEPTPGVAHIEDLAAAFHAGAKTPGKALGGALNRSEGRSITG